MPTANKHRAVVIGNTAGGMMVGPKMAPGLSAYLCSKLAQVRTLEYLAEEHPHLFVASAQPGIIDSPIFRASGATPEMLPMDTRKFCCNSSTPVLRVSLLIILL